MIDDNTATKYLNFAGNFDPNETASGFQVTPAIGATIVNEITFTTANDAAERDPIAFELYGSNDGIEGPYTLIASGYIMDFAAADAWPRFTKNATPITFENTTAYTNYQVLFTFLRDSASANSMQIAEVELIGVPYVELPKATVFAEGFESYEVGVSLHGQGGWKGWQGAEAPALRRRTRSPSAEPTRSRSSAAPTSCMSSQPTAASWNSPRCSTFRPAPPAPRTSS